MVGTPIGNRGDITFRALETLKDVDIIAAEDTRHTARLLAHHKIKTSLISYHDHNEKERTAQLLKKLRQGMSIALVSNAGTPSVSDPGYALINAAIADDIRVVPIPGPSAGITALSVSGLPTDTFVFIGFPAKKKAKRLTALKGLADEKRTVIFYESPRRIMTFLEELISAMGNRYAVLSREMTKVHEEFIRGGLSEILENLKARPAIKGEFTLLIAGAEKIEPRAAAIEELRHKLKKGDRSLSDIAKDVAAAYNISRNEIYREAIKIKGT